MKRDDGQQELTPAKTKDQGKDRESGSQGVYYTYDAIRSDIICHIIPQLKVTGDVAAIKDELIALSKSIYDPLSAYQKNLGKMERQMADLQLLVEQYNLEQNKLYQSLTEEARYCSELPVEFDGRWLRYEDVLPNWKYICEFAELVGYIADYAEEMFQ